MASGISMMYFVQIEGLIQSRGGSDLDFLWEGDLTRQLANQPIALLAITA